MSLRREIKEKAALWGADLCGIADLSSWGTEITREFTVPGEAFPRAVSIAVFLPSDILEEILSAPTAAYANAYETANRRLDKIIMRLNSLLEAKKYHTYPIPASHIVGPRQDRGIFSHRIAARKAGLGWIGKSCNLIHPHAGPRLRLATLLTDAPLECDAPVRDRCGSCTKCMDICPTGAILGHSFVFGEPRETRLDFDKCNDCLIENNKKLGQLVCGLCVAVCPWGRKMDGGGQHQMF